MSGTVFIDLIYFNNDSLIKVRVAAAPAAEQGALCTALRYVYKDDGPINLPRSRLLIAEPYLNPAERIVIRWLYTRTNGRLRKSYGAGALRAARSSRYRCQVCDFNDVRVLNIDHVDGHVAGTPFACLCANCHTIKSRENDWSGETAGKSSVEKNAQFTGLGTSVNLSTLPPQRCPVCRGEVDPDERYPRYVCQTCATKSTSADGRLLTFSNLGLSGGLIAQFADTGRKYPGNECYIDGIRCHAAEVYFGGIVIEGVEPNLFRSSLHKESSKL